MIKENIDDLMPPGLIYFLTYLAGDPIAYRTDAPGDLGDLGVRESLLLNTCFSEVEFKSLRFSKYYLSKELSSLYEISSIYVGY
jgi:hypothetical protein